MAPNDKIVLQANFAEWKDRVSGLPDVDPWLYYCLEQFLKSYVPDDEETLNGITDGGNDGGADGIYFIVNQRQFISEESELDPKGVSKARVIFFQVKHSGGFKPTEIEKWLVLTEDFFDLSKDPDSFGKRYNDKVKSMMQIWRDQYMRIVNAFPDITVEYYYITGDDTKPDDYALDSCARVADRLRSYINAECSTHCIAAAELWQQVQQRPPRNRRLRWAEPPMQADEGFVGLVKLTDYCKFLEDKPGVLAERIFESNVRGFQMDSSVNRQIMMSLEETSKQPNFWLLNNGVTIIAPNVIQVDRHTVQIDDAQIVNGLQTSRAIFSYISENNETDDDRAVLVRIITTDDQLVQDKIIRATNSQNRMMPASLRMTDQIHRNIEELFSRVDLFYDRRKGYYRDLGKSATKIVSVNAVAQAVISILLQRPDDARARPGDYFKDDPRYESVFDNDQIPLTAYLTCTQIMRQVEQFVNGQGISRSDHKNLKFYVAAMLAREVTSLAKPVAAKLPQPNKIDDKVIHSCFDRVKKAYEALAKTADRDAVARGPTLLKRLDAQWRSRQRRAKSGKGKSA